MLVVQESNTQTSSSTPLAAEYFSTQRTKASLLSEAWQDPTARSEVARIIRDGILKGEADLAERLLSELDILTENNLSDEQNLTRLRDATKKQEDQQRKDESFNRDEAERIQRRINQIIEFLPRSFNPESFIDIGCGDGRITEQLAVHWNVAKEDAIGTDVWDRHSDSDSYTYQTNSPDTLALESASLDYANLCMVLHHEEAPELLLREMYRVLKPGAIAFVREHDAETESDSRTFHALDLLYYSVFNDLKGIPVPAMYNAAEHWQSEFEKAGFKVLKDEHPEPDSPMKPMHFLLYKPRY